jgi:hypothetical protein
MTLPDPNLKGPCTIPHTTQTSGNRAGRSYSLHAVRRAGRGRRMYRWRDVHHHLPIRRRARAAIGGHLSAGEWSDLRSDLQLHEPRVLAVRYRCVGQQHHVLGGQGHQRRGAGDRRIHEKRRRDRVHAQPIDGVVARRHHDGGCGQQHGDTAVEQHLRRSRETCAVGLGLNLQTWRTRPKPSGTTSSTA